MDSDSQFEAFVDEAVSSWGREGGLYGYVELEESVIALYRSRLARILRGNWCGFGVMPSCVVG